MQFTGTEWLKLYTAQHAFFPKRKLKVKTIYSWHTTLFVLRCDILYSTKHLKWCRELLWHFMQRRLQGIFVLLKICISTYTLSLNFHRHVMRQLPSHTTSTRVLQSSNKFINRQLQKSCFVIGIHITAAE